jgi:hypothetical protein
VTGAESKSATETKEDRDALGKVVFEGVTEACNGILGAKKSIEGIVLPVDLHRSRKMNGVYSPKVIV